MADLAQATRNQLWVETHNVKLELQRVSGTEIRLNYSLPTDRKVVDGFIIVLSEKPIDPSCFPGEGQRYTASLDWNTPASTISHGKVVASLSKVFLDTVADIGSFTVTNVNPGAVYYAMIFPSTNILQYQSPGVSSYMIDDGVSSGIIPTHTGSIPISVVTPANPTLGQCFYNPIDNTVSMWTGSTWIPAGQGVATTGTANQRPTSPLPGAFHYNTNTRRLEGWNGTSWAVVNTADEGTPMYDKIGVGTDGTYDERLSLIEVLKAQLGAPNVCVEANEFQFNVAIDNAIEEFRRRCDNAYNIRYILFNVKSAQQLYYLNDPREGTDKVVSINKVHRMNALGFTNLSDFGVYGQTFINALVLPGQMVDILSIHTMANLSEEYTRIFAGDLVHTWDENTRQLFFLRAIQRDETLILEAMMERTEQEILTDRYAKQWLQAWAESEIMMMIGHTRAKYPTLPGPNGGISLNGDTLLTMAETMQTELLRQIQDFEVGNGGPHSGINCAFLMG